MLYKTWRASCVLTDLWLKPITFCFTQVSTSDRLFWNLENSGTAMHPNGLRAHETVISDDFGEAREPFTSGSWARWAQLVPVPCPYTGRGITTHQRNLSTTIRNSQSSHKCKDHVSWHWPPFHTRYMILTLEANSCKMGHCVPPTIWDFTTHVNKYLHDINTRHRIYSVLRILAEYGFSFLH